jgi:VWFA-related protein
LRQSQAPWERDGGRGLPPSLKLRRTPEPRRRRQTAPFLRLGVAIAVLCGTVVAGQQAPVFRSRVDAIEIEMRVVDRDGTAISDLEQAEVEVLENGRRHEILAFSRVTVPIAPPRPEAARSAAAPPSPDVSSNRVVGASRIFVLVLDDLHVDRRNTQQVKQAARRFVERHVQPGDLVSVVYTGVRPDAAQDFTLNRQLLLTAIDKFVGRKLPPATIERMDQYNMLFRARGRPTFEDLRDPLDAERAFNARAAMASIEEVSTTLARITGRRKAALLFTEGLDYDLSGLRSQGRSAGSVGPTALPSTIPTGGSEADALGRLDVHSYAHDVLLSLQAAMGAAARANVVLYPMDVQGGNTTDTLADLGAPADDPALGLSAQHVNQEMRDAQETLTVLAANTGGFASLTPSDYDSAFARIVRESSEYYVLAYSPWNPAPDGTYREITVNVKRPGVRVSARRGYYASRQPARRPVRFVGSGLSEETSALVMAPIGAPGLTLDLNAVAFKGDRKRADVVVTTHVDGEELAQSSSGAAVSNTLELALMATDSAGRVQAATARAIEVRLDEAASRLLRSGGYRVISGLQLPPGRYQIRQAVRERNGGRQGSVFGDLEVPDFSGRLTMGGVVLTSVRGNLVPTAIDQQTYAALRVIPSVRRAFPADDELIAVVEISDPSGRDVQVVTTLVDDAGREHYRRVANVAGREIRVAGGVYRHSIQIPLENARGSLTLAIEALPVVSPGERVGRRLGFHVTGR